MKHLFTLILILVIVISFTSCNKESVGRAISNSGPGNNYGYVGSTWYHVKATRTNNYPSGSTLLIKSHTIPKGSSIIHQNTAFSKKMPFNDTTIKSMELKDFSITFTWKVTGPNNDSLSGGKTNTQITKDTELSFLIDY